MYSEKQFDQLEQEEHSLTDEALVAALLILGELHSNLESTLREFYQKYGKDGVITYAEARKWVSEKDHRKRMTLLWLLIGDEFGTFHRKINPKFDTFLTQVINKELGFFGVDLDVEKILNTPWGVDKTTWVIRLSNDVEKWNAYVNIDLKRAIMKGQSLDDVLKSLNERFDNIGKALKKLGFTESTAVGSIARNEIFKELGITKYKFYSREDERTCEECGALHGMIFPVSAYEVGVNASPIHSHCRCWTVPIKD